jgi:hypothetical protein
VRCSPAEDAWIVHIRLLPATWEREVIKCRCIKSYHLVLPEWVSRQILKVPGWAQHLRYAGERNRPLGSRVNAYPLALIPQGTEVVLRADMEIR